LGVPAPLFPKLHPAAALSTNILHGKYLACLQLTLLFSICPEVHGSLARVLPQRSVFSQPSFMQLLEKQNMINIIICVVLYLKVLVAGAG